MESILRIIFSSSDSPKVSKEPLGGYAGLGGRGLTSAILSKEVNPLCHALGPENKLVIAPGLLSGSPRWPSLPRTFLFFRPFGLHCGILHCSMDA